MVASRQVEILFYRGIGRQRGRGFGALASDIARNILPILRKYILQTANCLGTDWLEFAVPEIADVASGQKKFKTAAKTNSEKTMG